MMEDLLGITISIRIEHLRIMVENIVGSEKARVGSEIVIDRVVADFDLRIVDDGIQINRLPVARPRIDFSHHVFSLLKRLFVQNQI